MILFLKNLLFTVIVPGTVAVYIPLLLTRDRAIPGGLRLVPPMVLFALGTVIYAWTVWDFANFGRGTPAPVDAPKKLVVRGLYRFTRNPMYVGVLTFLSGQVVLFRSTTLLLYAAAVFAGFHTWTVVYEEPRLAAAFGSDYESYRRRVGRWIPRLRRHV